MKRKRAFVPVCSADWKCCDRLGRIGVLGQERECEQGASAMASTTQATVLGPVGNERSVQEHHDDHLDHAVLDERHHRRIFIALHEREIDVVLSNNEQHGQTAEERVFEPPQTGSRELDGAQDQAGDERPEGRSAQSGAPS